MATQEATRTSSLGHRSMEDTSSPPANLTPSEAEALIREGIQQEVNIPLRCMLVSVMESIKSPRPPIFECTKVGDVAFKATVKLDVSTTRVTTDSSVTVKEITGSVCLSPELVVSSAVHDALEYLSSSHFVEIQDHSNQVADNFPMRTNWMTARKLLDGIKNAVVKISGSLDGLSKLRRDVEVNGMSEMTNGVQTTMGSIYVEVAKCLGDHTRSYNESLKALKEELGRYEAICDKDHEEGHNKARMWRLKPHYQVGYVTEKAILGYLMTYLGWEQPNYGNTYFDDLGFIGHVTLPVPETVKNRCEGKIKIRADYGVTRAADAEELAAFKALCFMDDKLKVKPVDLNYQVRVKAMERHQLVVQLIDNCRELVNKVSKVWEDLNNSMRKTCTFYAEDYTNIHAKELTADNLEKLEMFTKQFQDLVDESVKVYNNAVKEMKDLHECMAVNI